MDKVFAKYTKKIINALPYWFKIKKDPNNSIGATFLNITGLELDEIEYILEYAYKQTNLVYSDTQYLDIVYKGSIPKYIYESDVLILKTESSLELTKTNTIEDFYLTSNNNMINPELKYDDPYYIDYNTQIIYTKKKYSELTISINEDEDLLINLTLHNVWNFFDEIGMLFNLPRIYSENNFDYKKRLLDVFKNLPGSSIESLFNSISRELGLKKEIIVLDETKGTTIEDPMIVLNEIKRNDYLIDLEDIYITENNCIYINGVNGGNPLDSCVISYISGIQMHNMSNEKDFQLRNKLFTLNKTPTNLLQKYINLISTEVPILWGEWKWNQGYWDVANENITGKASIPNIVDSSISGFIGYKRGV